MQVADYLSIVSHVIRIVRTIIQVKVNFQLILINLQYKELRAIQWCIIVPLALHPYRHLF